MGIHRDGKEFQIIAKPQIEMIIKEFNLILDNYILFLEKEKEVEEW